MQTLLSETCPVCRSPNLQRGAWVPNFVGNRQRRETDDVPEGVAMVPTYTGFVQAVECLNCGAEWGNLQWEEGET